MATAKMQREFTPKYDYKSNRESSIKYVISHIKRYLAPFLFVIVLTLGNSILQSLVPQYIGQIFQLYDEKNLTVSNLTRISKTILLLGVSAGFLVLFRNFTTEFISQKLEKSTRDELYSSLLGKSLTWHDSQKIGDLMTRATQDVRQINFMFNPGFNLVFSSIVGILIPTIFIAFIDMRLILVPFFTFIIFYIMLKRYNRAQTPYAMKTRMASSNMQSRLNETISGMHVVRGASQEDKERIIFKKNIEMYRDAQVKLGEIQAKYWPLLLQGVATAAAIFHGAYLYQSGEIDTGELIQFILLFGLYRFPFFINIFAITLLTLGNVSAGRILELLEGDSEIDQNPQGVKKVIDGSIEFKNVTFGYHKDTPILKNVSFSINPGQTVALVGMSGAGKTSITKLLARLYDPSEGEILVDGINLKDWSIQSLREQMALVEQDIFLFSRSIKDNILLGNSNATMEEIEEVTKMAQAYDFIMDTKEKFDTQIGERGTQLSGGQKQRLAISRALIKNPRILILDDSSSAIDSKTEDEINLAIKNVLKGRVSFLITHRIAQIRRADVIILVDQGKILDIGNHEELLKKSSKYREIFSIYDDFELMLEGST